MEKSQPDPAVSGVVVTTSRVPRLAVAAYLARSKASPASTPSQTCGGTSSAASCVAWPLSQRPGHTLSSTSAGYRKCAGTDHRRCRGACRLSAGFYRTCVIDGVLEHSPAEYVRRPHVPAESPTLGLTHLQFEALLTAAKQSPNRCDFALVTMLGLLGLRIFEATGSDIGTSARSTATGFSACTARAARSSSSRFPQRWAVPSTGPATTGPRDRSC